MKGIIRDVKIEEKDIDQKNADLSEIRKRLSNFAEEMWSQGVRVLGRRFDGGSAKENLNSLVELEITNRLSKERKEIEKKIIEDYKKLLVMSNLTNKKIQETTENFEKLVELKKVMKGGYRVKEELQSRMETQVLKDMVDARVMAEVEEKWRKGHSDDKVAGIQNNKFSEQRTEVEVRGEESGERVDAYKTDDERNSERMKREKARLEAERRREAEQKRLAEEAEALKRGIKQDG